MKPTLIESKLANSLANLKKIISESQLDELGSSGIASAQASNAQAAGKPASTAPTPAVSNTTPAKPVSWKDIYNLNKETIGTDPNRIRVGAELKMPDGSTYTVQSGDNLSKIAKNYKPAAQPASSVTEPKPEEPQWKPDTSLAAGPQPGPSGKIGEKPWDATIEFNKLYANPPTEPEAVKQLQAWLSTRGVNGVKPVVNGVMDDATKLAMQKYKEYLDRAFQYESTDSDTAELSRIIELVKR